MQPNWIDKAVTFLDPQAGLRRIRARAATEGLLRYEGAQRGRRTANWMATGGSANAEIGPDLAYLRARSRDLVRNNPLVSKALRVLVANTVGAGIRPEADTGNEALNDTIDAAFEKWCLECDADGQLDFFGIQQLIDRTIRESGEVVIRDRYRRAEDGFHVPYQVQVLEPDYIDSSRQLWPNQFQGANIAGVTFDQLGVRRGYWLWPFHPGDVVKSGAGWTSKEIPASLVTHIYEKDRPGQVRGVPRFAPIMLAAYDLDGYEDAERMRKKIEACLSVFVEQAEGPDGPGLAAETTDRTTGARIETVEPGMIEYLKPGETIKTATPAQTGGYGEYVTKQERRLAAGAGVMYEQMTGDLSLVNYSSFRAGNLEFRADVEAYRAKTLIPMGLRPIWNKFIDAAFVSRRIPSRNYGCRWTVPPWQSIDPEKDATANLLDVRVGRKTWDQSCVEAGLDPEKQLLQIAARNKAFDSAGVVLDIDPRRVDRNRGAFQLTPPEATK
ncbi:MAG: Phage portal protein lambda family [Bryobacterales bacterium]|nr:Phage portal protein lambda family [Bryobacterales bacterium]